MKLKHLSIFLCGLLLSGSLLTACGDDDPSDPSDPSQPINPEPDPDPSNVLSPADQKAKMETIALDFMNATPASDFKAITDLGQYITKTYFDEYKWDAVDKWAQQCLDAASKATGVVDKETESDGYYIENYFFTKYTSLLMASNFTGKFTAQDRSWKRSDASDLSFVFRDQNGAECVLRLTTSGNVKKVHFGAIDEWIDYKKDYDSDADKYIYNEYYDRTEYTIGVPENIVVTLTQGGSTVVKTTVKVDLKSITGEEFDISKNAITVNALVELNNGYKFDLSEVAYTGNTKASATFKVSKGGQQLITLGMAADVQGLPSCNVSAFSHENFDFDDLDFDNANGKNAYVKIDVMGKMQMQGVVSDCRKYADYLEEADDNDDDEASFKSYLNQANALAQYHVFYDNKSTKQASMKFEPFVDETWNGTTYWRAEPVIIFYDNSSYSTFSAFFNEKDFKTVIDNFKKLAEKYADLVDEEFDW